MNTKDANTTRFGKWAFIIGLSGLAVVSLLVAYVLVSPLSVLLLYYPAVTVFPLIGLAGIIIGIVALVKKGHRVLPIIGIIFSLAWFFPIGYFISVQVLNDPHKDPYAICDEKSCTWSSYSVASKDIQKEEGTLRKILSYVSIWDTTKPLHTSSCTLEGRIGDEWQKTIRGTTYKSQETIFSDLKEALKNDDPRLDVYEFSETGDAINISYMDNGQPYIRIIVTVINGNVTVDMRSTCFKPVPEKYQLEIDADKNK